jgi:hypothetical protein
MRTRGRTPEPRGGELAHGSKARRSDTLRSSFACGAALVIGASIGAAGGDGSAVPMLVGAVTAGGALLFTAGGSGDARETIDTLGRREIVRARRATRPVTLAAVTVAGSRLREDLETVAAELAVSIRETDLIGYGHGSRLFLVFTETSGDEAVSAWARLRAELGPALAEEVQVGMASFPEDNSTWDGLKALASERARGATSENAKQPRPHGATVPTEA